MPKRRVEGLEAAATQWHESQSALAAAKRDLVNAVRAEYEAGASEYEIAERAGITRMTVRRFLGKYHGPKRTEGST